MVDVEPSPVKGLVYATTLLSVISGALFGWDLGAAGGVFVMNGFKEHFGWPLGDEDVPPHVSEQMGWITMLFSIGALFGSVPSGTIADRIGRRMTIQFNSVFYIIACLVSTFAVNVNMLYAGRFLQGASIGVFSGVVVMYDQEIAPSHIRGKIGTAWQFSIGIGKLAGAIVIIFTKNWDEGWRLSYGGVIPFALAMFVAFFYLPESPRWLASKGRIAEARKQLMRVRVPADVEIELSQITPVEFAGNADASHEEYHTTAPEKQSSEHVVVSDEDVAHEEKTQNIWLQLISMKNRMTYRLMLGVGLQFFQQTSGVMAIMTFSPDIFSKFMGENALFGNLAMQSVNVFVIFFTIYAIDKFGRITLLWTGGLGMLVANLVVATCSSPLFDYETSTGAGIGILVGSCLFVSFFGFSWGPIPWVVCPELFPQHLRGPGVSVTTATNWITAALVTKIMPTMYRPENLDLWGTYLVFCGFIILGQLFVITLVPETGGVPLEDMDEHVKDFKAGFQRRPLRPRMNRHKDEIRSVQASTHSKQTATSAQSLM